MFGTYQLPIQKGTDLFPATMQPPATIRTIIMDRLGLWQDYQQDMIDAGNRIIRNRLGEITSFFHGQRQNYSLSIVHGSRTRLSLPQLEVEYYCMPNGQEHLTITVDPANEVSKKAEDDTPCLLILYASNKVAAVRMDNLRGRPIYTATLKKSSWGISGVDYLYTVQLKLQKGFSAIMWNVSVVGGTITSDDNTYYHFTTNRLEQQAKSTSTWNTAILGAGNGDAAPIFNGDGAGTYYGTQDNFIVGADGRITVSDDIGFDQTGGTPYAIGPDGARYYSATGFSAAPLIDVASVASRFDMTLWTFSYSPTAAGPISGAAASVFYRKNLTLVQDLVTSYPYTYEQSPGVFVTEYGANGSASVDLPMAHYSNDGVLDNVNIGLEKLSVSIATADTHPHNYATSTITFRGQSWTLNTDQPKVITESIPAGRDPQELTYIMWFPFSFADGRNYVQTAQADPWFNNTTILGDRYGGPFRFSTPYGSFSAVNTYWEPFLHVSNGKHVMQAFQVDGAQYFFLDGVAWTPPVSGAVQSVVMDVPLKRIKQFG